MRNDKARVLIPGEVILPEALRRRYPKNLFEFDTADRARSNAEHRELFEAVGRQKQRLVCGCRTDVSVPLLIRTRKPPYLARLQNTGLDHDSTCAFFHAPIPSYSEDSITIRENGTMAVRLGFWLGEPRPKKELAGECPIETGLRTRTTPSHTLNRFGPEGLLRLVFDVAGLNLWRPRFRFEHRRNQREDGSLGWKPCYAKILSALNHIDVMRKKEGTLKNFLRIGQPGDLRPFPVGTRLGLIDVIERIEPPKQGTHWKCYLAGWGKRFVLIEPEKLLELLLQLRFARKNAEQIIKGRTPAQPRDMESWWGCLVVEVRTGTKESWYGVADHAAIRTEEHGIPIESLPEAEMTAHLIAQGRSFAKPLFAGRLAALPNRRPDFILEDTPQPCCLEVTGMRDGYDYNDRHENRLEEYLFAKIPVKSWEPGQPWPMLDAGAFAPIRS